MSGRSASIAPRSRPAPERPPVENCTIMPGAVLAQALEQPPEPLRVGGRRLVVVAHVAVHDAGAGLEGRLRALDLLGDGDRHRGVVRLPRQAAGDGDADDAGLGSDIEEHRLVLALQADVEAVDRLAVARPRARRSASPRRLACSTRFEHRVLGVGLGLVAEVHPGVEPDVDAAGDDPEVEVRRHRPAAAARHRGRASPSRSARGRCRSRRSPGPSRGSPPRPRPSGGRSGEA